MKVYMFDLKTAGDNNYDFSNKDVVFDLDFDVEVYDVLKKGNDYYSICGLNTEKNMPL